MGKCLTNGLIGYECCHMRALFSQTTVFTINWVHLHSINKGYQGRDFYCTKTYKMDV